jgi:hypothetical protein
VTIVKRASACKRSDYTNCSVLFCKCCIRQSAQERQMLHQMRCIGQLKRLTRVNTSGREVLGLLVVEVYSLLSMAVIVSTCPTMSTSGQRQTIIPLPIVTIHKVPHPSHSVALQDVGIFAVKAWLHITHTAFHQVSSQAGPNNNQIDPFRGWLWRKKLAASLDVTLKNHGASSSFRVAHPSLANALSWTCKCCGNLGK